MLCLYAVCLNSVVAQPPLVEFVVIDSVLVMFLPFSRGCFQSRGGSFLNVRREAVGAYGRRGVPAAELAACSRGVRAKSSDGLVCARQLAWPSPTSRFGQ